MKKKKMRVEEMMDLENYHLATTIIIAADENYQWMLGPAGERVWRSAAGLHCLQASPYNIGIHYQGKENSFTVEKTDVIVIKGWHLAHQKRDKLTSRALWRVRRECRFWSSIPAKSA